MNIPAEPRIQCAYCAVESPASEVECPACGASLREGNLITEALGNSLEELIGIQRQLLPGSPDRRHFVGDHLHRRYQDLDHPSSDRIDLSFDIFFSCLPALLARQCSHHRRHIRARS